MSAHMSHSGMAAAGCCSSSCQRVTACRILVGRSSRRPARRQPSFSVDQRALTLTGRARRPDRLLGSHPLIDLTGTACCGWPGRPARPAQCRSGPLAWPIPQLVGQVGMRLRLVAAHARGPGRSATPPSGSCPFNVAREETVSTRIGARSGRPRDGGAGLVAGLGRRGGVGAGGHWR